MRDAPRSCSELARRSVPEVLEKEDRISRPRQEEEGGDAGRPPGHEEEAGCLNSRLNLFPAKFSRVSPSEGSRGFSIPITCSRQNENLCGFPSNVFRWEIKPCQLRIFN